MRISGGYVSADRRDVAVDILVCYNRRLTVDINVVIIFFNIAVMIF